MKIQIRNKVYEVSKDPYKDYWEEIITGKWEPFTFTVLDYFVSPGDTVMDIGAWIGPVTLYAAHSASRILAVEPDPVAFAHLQNNLHLNPELESKITSFNVALSDKYEKFTLYARKEYGVSSTSLLPRIRDKLFTKEIQGVTLRKFIENEKIERIDFVKMDIEGSEFLLLPVIADDLRTFNYPTLYISFHLNYLTENQYFLHIKWALLSRILMKLENYTGIRLFEKKIRNIILYSLLSLKDYEFFYSDSGEKLSYSFLLSNPFFIRKHNLVISNKEWIMENL